MPNHNTYNIFIEVGQDSIITYFEQAFQDAQAGNLNEAIAGFTRVIEINDTFAEAYFNRGLLKLLADDSHSAIPDLSKAGELGIFQAYNIIKKNQNLNLKKKTK